MDQNSKIENPFELILKRLYRIEEILSKLRQPDNNYEVVQPDVCLGMELAIKITGLKKKTIYNLVCKRMIPHSKRGKRLYFDEQELKDWIRGGKRKTIEELGIAE